MASADSSRTVIIISDETDEQPLARGTRTSQRKRTFTDYSYPIYNGPFDDLVSSDALESKMEQPPKKQKISNLDTVLEMANQEIHTIFEAERAKRRKLEEEVQKLEEEVQHLHAEMTMKDELFDTSDMFTTLWTVIANERTKASCAKPVSTRQKGSPLRWDAIANLTLTSMLQLLDFSLKVR
ncbi:uncharacterized protein CIMG_05339 [Coccidioides immitis RS]|uniref:Uncharacterized protein n=1 Tax=Coccidioides immitis (strain RS) TaxID=246410 RepID=J3KFC6_COCIM|nr:uncharacterized protein CIMG_05339 [Coccidioides immitis RS]EAS34315.3 hypothetical protein CIMG_05339 [Coccidioides immitis RS]